jgi:hypothetical protein
MKIAKEYQLLIIIGLFIFAYVLEALVNPLQVNLSSPYAFLAPAYFLKYPFTSAVILINAIAIFWTPLLLLSFIKKAYAAKASILLVLAALLQLYTLQEIATGAEVMPLEWSLALALGGILLLLPTLIFFAKHGATSVHDKVYLNTPRPTDSLLDDDDDDD